MNVRRVSIVLLMAAALVPECFCPIPASGQNTKVSPVAPRREQVEAVVKEAYEKYKNDTNGKNADYIPYLAKVDSKLFGIAVVTTDNQVLTFDSVRSMDFNRPVRSKPARRCIDCCKADSRSSM